MADFHPLAVHFPVALLTLYSLFELVRIHWLKQPWIFPLKAVLVITGFLGAIAAFITGSIAGEALKDGPAGALLDLHEVFAVLTLWVFGVLALCYVLVWCKQLEKLPLLSTARKAAQRMLMWPSWILAFVGLLVITLTGALGGALAYGPSTDPLVAFVHSLFF